MGEREIDTAGLVVLNVDAVCSQVALVGWHDDLRILNFSVLLIVQVEAELAVARAAV